MFTKNGVDGLQNPLFTVRCKILHRGDKLLAKALRPQHPKHLTISCVFDGRKANAADTGTWPGTILTTNTCLNCFGAMAKLPPMYHVIVDDRVHSPSSEAKTSRIY